MSKAENKQIGTFEQIDSIRRELDTKIEQKVSNEFFRWTVGILFTVIILICGGLYKLNDKVDVISKNTAVSTAVAETKIADMK